jgi:hypothetical protein
MVNMPRYRNDIIKWRQEKLGKSNDAIERETGRSRNTVSRARAGKNLTVDALVAIAGSLGLDMRCLFDFKLPLAQAHRAVLRKAENGGSR